MPANDIAGQVGTAGPSNTGALDFRPPPQTPVSQGGQGMQYDADGYPLPNADQIKAAQYTYSFDANGQKTATGTVAYDPSMSPPSPDSENPFQPGSSQAMAWVNHNNKKKQNQANKEAWQKQHETQRQQKPAAVAPQSSAPATPFQSSGIDLTQQGKGESYIDSILDSYGQSGVPQVGNESQKSLEDYRAAGPSGESQKTLDAFRKSQPADMNPYYNYASKLTSAKIDNAMASRGSYGSSNAIGQLGAAEVALRAGQARDNAQYGLQRFAQEGTLAGQADQRRDAYYGQEGQLAGQADQQGNVANGIQYQWTKGLADMAAKDQEMGQERNQNLWNNNFSLAAAKAGIYGAGANAAIADVNATTDAYENAKQGQATDALSNSNANANASNSATAGLLNAAAQGTSNYLKYNNGKSN